MSRARVLAAGPRLAVEGLVGLWQNGRVMWQRTTRALAQRGDLAGARIDEWISARTRPAPLRHGLSAVERGNLDAAFALLREAAELRPSDVKTALAFWELALACERAAEAADAMAGVVHLEAASERRSEAVTHWTSLMSEVPTAVVDPASLARLLPELKLRVVTADDPDARDRACAWLVSALRQCLDRRGGELTPGLALRVFEEARPFDSDVARRAAEIVLASPDLHETKRRRVEALVASLDGPVAAPAPSPTPEPTLEPMPEPSRPVPPIPHEVDAPDADVAEPITTSPWVVIESIPVELEERSLLLLEIERGQRSRVDYRAVEAVSVARVDEDGTSVLLIDLVLQRSRQHAMRRILRMREDSFEAKALFPDPADHEDALRTLLAELLERTHATPLPDPDSALGLQPRHFHSIDAYETDILDRLTG